MGWKQIASETEGRKMSSDMTTADVAARSDFNTSSISPESLLFAREVCSFFFLENLHIHLNKIISNIF